MPSQLKSQNSFPQIARFLIPDQFSKGIKIVRKIRKMFFFLVGGLQRQARQVLKRDVGRCIACGSRADLVEYEKVLKLFFVPVWRWPGKEAAMHCNNCNLLFPQEALDTKILKCQFCAREVEPSFRFCPSCGSAL